jgi:nucleoside-diphosphate-sugar epimerase
MSDTKPSIVVTGAAGNLGRRLLPLLAEYSVTAVDLAPPATTVAQFVSLDLGKEESCRELFHLFQQVRPVAVVHLAFVLDPVRAGVLDIDRMWQINVAGTARVLEAVSETNRNGYNTVRKFIHLSSVAAYGPELPRPAAEETRLGAHTLPYAIHKQEADEVVQTWAPSLPQSSVYLLRPHIFTGASVDNYMVGAFRGTPNGKGRWAEKLRAKGKRLPCMLPRNPRFREKKIQFVHVDDVARLIAHIAGLTEPETQRLNILNVAGRGPALTYGRCVELAQAKLLRMPGLFSCRMVLEALWKSGISAIPPEALPYMTGEYIMDTSHLETWLGLKYPEIIQYTIEEAFRDTFRNSNQDPLLSAGAGATPSAPSPGN